MTRKVVVFGGTGFLGRRAVQHMARHELELRVASRHPGHGQANPPAPVGGVEFVKADIGAERAIEAAIEGAFGVVNAVSLYLERNKQTFQSIHVEAAERLAKLSLQAGVERLIHVSGIGADATSPSPYIRSRGQGEQAVRAAFPPAVIVRPAVMFGPDDAFLMPLTELLRKLPVFPLFGGGGTLLQPAYVEDVGEAIARIMVADEPAPLYELAGPRIWRYEELLRAISDHLGERRPLLPMPFPIWHTLAFLAELLPEPPLTRNQVELMQIDNTASPAAQGFGSLGIAPAGVEKVLAKAEE